MREGAPSRGAAAKDENAHLQQENSELWQLYNYFRQSPASEVLKVHGMILSNPPAEVLRYVKSDPPMPNQAHVDFDLSKRQKRHRTEAQTQHKTDETLLQLSTCGNALQLENSGSESAGGGLSIGKQKPVTRVSVKSLLT